MEDKGFLKNHADTMMIIGVNIAVAAVLITMQLAASSRIDSANQRMDTMHMMFYDMLKEKRS